MPDLREKYGENYYKDIRKKRIVPARGYIQTLSPSDRKIMSQKGHATRWKKIRDGRQLS